MKKIFLFFALVFSVPFLLFSDDFIFHRYFYSHNSTNLNSFVYRSSTGSFLSALQSFKLSDVALSIRRGSVLHPSFGNKLSSSVSIDTPFSTNGNSSVWSSINSVPEIYSVYGFLYDLVRSGYSGPGITSDITVSNIRHLNMNYSVAVQDVALSTNVLFRSLLLSHLQSISSVLLNIESNLSSIGSSIPSDPFVSDFHAALQAVQSLDLLSSIDYSYFYQTYDSLNTPEEKALFARSVSELFDGYNSGPGLLNAFSLPSSTSKIQSLGNNLNKGVSDILNGGGSGGGSGGIAGDVKRLSTNDWASVVTNQLAKNSQASKDQLKSNHDSITNQLANMFDNNPNSIGRAIRDASGNTASIAASSDSIAQKLNGSVTVHVENANSLGVVLDGPITVEQSQFQQVSVPIEGIKNKLQDFYNDWYNFFDVSTTAYSWGNYYTMLERFKDQNHLDLVSVTNSLSAMSSTNSCQCLASVSNLLASIDDQLSKAFPVITNGDFFASSSFSALLLDDYSDYITNNFYSSALDSFREDFPSVHSNLVKYGLSSDPGSGNFWSLFSSTLFYQSALVCGMLEDLSTVRQFAENNIEGGFNGGVTSLISKFPSPTQLEDYLNHASNEVQRIQYASDDFQSAYSYMTNSSVSAFSPFRGVFSSVPDELVFFKTGNEQNITIPVSLGRNAWLVIRLCFSFSLAAVNVILFPKFVLMVIVLLSKLSKRFVKFVPTDS